MNLNTQQRENILQIIEGAKEKEYARFNVIIENAVSEWKTGVKTNKEAYNKIYKKVVKNEHHLTQRYADIDDSKSLRTLAEVFSDDIISMDDFMNLDEEVRSEVHKITGLRKK